MEKFKLSHIVGIIIALMLFSTSVIGYYVYNSMKDRRMGGDFTLTYRDQPWTLSEHAKPLNLLYVGYVKCPDVCPMSLSHSAKAFEKLNDEERKKVQLIFISVDAAHDTAASVADYASQFFADFIGLTGSNVDLTQAITKFGASFMVESAPKSHLGYSIAHTDRLFYLNPKGKLIDSISSPRSSDEIVTKIREHL